MPRVRLAGVRATHLAAAGPGGEPRELTGRSAGWQDLETAMDRARDRFGAASLARGSTLRNDETVRSEGSVRRDGASRPGTDGRRPGTDGRRGSHSQG